MPKLGESIMEATILKWHKQPGDTIALDETVLEIATDKVDSEVPSTAAGTIQEILFNVNEVVPIGTVIARIQTSATQPASSIPSTPPTSHQAPSPASTQPPIQQSSINTQITAHKPITIGANRFYSPLVLNIAANEGISMSELEKIPGSGGEGRVTKKDILQYLAVRTQPAVSAPQELSIPLARIQPSTPILSTSSSVTSGNVEIIEMDRMRKLIADHMVKSKQTSPHVTSFTEADVTNLVLWREKVKKDFEKREGTKITYTPLFIEAIVRCIKKFPLINSSLDGGNIILKKDDTGNEQMFSEENEVFEDNTIVEFRYDLTREGQWRWVPLRVRYDKTSEFRRGIKNYGNAYHVANSNWYSIHNPISEEMISTGQDIPDEIGGDDDVYYNRVGVNSINQTKAMRDFHNLFVKKLLIKSVANKGDSLIDVACGKGGDFSKWINAQLAFVFGIDISKDNLENKLDGACARYLNYRKKFKHIPYALFVNGNSGLNIKNGSAMMNDKAIQITKAVFGEGVKDESKLGKGVTRQFGKGTNGFSISSCQFALHYFFKDKDTLLQFLKNVAETTALNGYFIGTCYDGKLIFDLLKNVEKGNGIQINDGENKVKIWEIKKDYSDEKFPDDSNCVGYKIDVFQESINQLISEYLVNFDYLNRLMENFGFKIVSREEAKQLGLPEGNGLFSELYMIMLEEMKKNKYTGMGSEYGEANHMSAYEKKISFLNRYFVYKKIRHVNTNKVVIDDNDINNDDEVDIEVYEKEKSPDNNNIELSIKEVVPEVEPETIVLEVPKPKKTRAQPASKTTKKLKQKMVIEA